jgi:hypothetical protein
MSQSTTEDACSSSIRMTDVPVDRYRQVLLEVMRVATRLPDLTERLAMLSTAWTIVASDARHQQLFVPGGFQTVQGRQLDELAKLARLVREDTPDLEYQRLLHEGNFDSLFKYLRRRLNELDGGRRDQTDL